MPDLETSLDLCTYCPRLCSHTCPVSLTSGREALTPQAKMSRFGELSRTPAEFAEPDAALPLYGCTGCGACTTFCLHKVEPANVLLRGRAAARGAHEAVLGHPALADLPERHRHRSEAAAESLFRDSEVGNRPATDVAFLPTCLPRGPEGDGPAREALAALRVCDRLREKNVNFPSVGVALPSENDVGNCAGYPLYAGGFAESFRLHAESFARSVEGYSTLALSCSACTWLLRTQYREHGVPLAPKVLHISELLAPYAESLPIKKPLASVAYHDPCHLGRRLGCFEPPRQLLRRAVTTLNELPGFDGSPESRCCGSGGLLPMTDPKVASAMAKERLSDVEPGQGPLVTGCPACQHHLAKSGDADVRGLIEILDEATSD